MLPDFGRGCVPGLFVLGARRLRQRGGNEERTHQQSFFQLNLIIRLDLSEIR